MILGALSFRKEYDGHTIDRALEQVKRITGKTPAPLAGDRGYRGQKRSGDTGIEIPGTPKVRDIRCQKQKKRKLFCRQQTGIEARIGHLKSARRLRRNFYRGLQGDAINIMPAAAFNFKRAMSLLLGLIKKINETLLEINVSLKYAF